MSSSISAFYNPIWDAGRGNLPGRAYEDEELILASNFECGNGYRFRKTAEARYVFELEPDPGHHVFSGKAYYFCIAALNKNGAPKRITLEVRNPIFHETSWPQATKFIIVRRGASWSHLPVENLLPAPDGEAIAFEVELPSASANNPLLFFSNYHWYPWSEMAATLRRLGQEQTKVRTYSIGKSAQGRDIWAIELGRIDDDAPTIVSAATPQPNEMGHHACRGILNFLLSDDKAAQAILKTHRICLVPHPNPDGTVMGYTASDALGNFLYFMGDTAIEGHAEAPVEMTALWNYLQAKRPWLFFEWHSNHMDRRKGHMLLCYDSDLAQDQFIRNVWINFDRRLKALPNAYPETRTTLTTGYIKSIGLGVAVKLGGIAVMLKLHEKYPLEESINWVIRAFRSATDAYTECRNHKERQP